MSEQNKGWVVFSPRGGGQSRIQKYQHRMVIIISGGKYPRIYLTEAVMSALKDPKFIRISMRGSNVALMSNPDRELSFTVALPDGGATPHIAVTSLVKTIHLVSGVYDAHYEQGAVPMVVFDSADTPSQF